MRKLLLVIMVFVVSLLISCGGNYAPSESSGVPYEYYKDLIINGENYKVFTPNDINKSLSYKVIRSTETTESELWKVNTIVDLTYRGPSYFTDSDCNELYDFLITDTIFDNITFDVSIKKSELTIVEGDIENNTNDEMGYLVFISYSNFMVRGAKGYFYVGIPVYEKIVGIDKDNNTYDPFTLETISYSELRARYSL